MSLTYDLDLDWVKPCRISRSGHFIRKLS